MYKRFFAWMSQFSRSLLPMIVSLGILATTYGTFNLLSKVDNVTATNDQQVLSSNSISLVNVSFGDKQTESYSGTRDITVYRSPSCNCCGAWVKHMHKNGFNIQADIKTDDVDAIKQKYNLPPELASCHTAIIDGYVMEGHIPADDIKNFLQQKPPVTGLAVPGMVIGTPGMESGDTKQPFTVMTFDKTGKTAAFKEYLSY
ncbi:hypothetical protein NOS3756_14480 [Nostoc sp. NIES-3756]|uniref:DUF411 domain-containing protein n=1 Tax=Nostoc sp. NIES-3756 TaxID=1751286 RepID=UPI00071FF52C|nr:DUF411 domain-containing protein [Nostoc sp. NIES-3756]BAT52508.1 hypothetical protein NOS3756_14480 [Nostoc sp. NIES-3756]BAY39804.1 hypothetical protein NIES2111_41810 [Nostoc sp. NIES-2111]